jgi:hypothetical protein
VLAKKIKVNYFFEWQRKKACFTYLPLLTAILITVSAFFIAFSNRTFIYHAESGEQNVDNKFWKK